MPDTEIKKLDGHTGRGVATPGAGVGGIILPAVIYASIAPPVLRYRWGISDRDEHCVRSCAESLSLCSEGETHRRKLTMSFSAFDCRWLRDPDLSNRRLRCGALMDQQRSEHGSRPADPAFTMYGASSRVRKMEGHKLLDLRA
jgi:hypothetical protein